MRILIREHSVRKLPYTIVNVWRHPKTRDSCFRAYSYYNRTGGNDDDERHIDADGHTAVSDYGTASELCIMFQD